MKELSPQQLQLEVEQLAAHIAAGKGLEHIDTKVNECCLQALDQEMESTPSTKVLEDLNAVLLRSIEKGIDKSHENQLNVILQLRNQIIAAHPITDELVEGFIEDPIRVILSNLSPAELGRVSTVSKRWSSMTPDLLINAINKGQLPLKEVFQGMDAKQVVDWLSMNPACKFLEYADFSEFDDFENEWLQKLTEHCPNLKHLLIPTATINGDALKHLAKTPGLLSLNIEYCNQLEADALKHLAHTPGLLSLNIGRCSQLETDALKHLTHTPGLLSLNIWMCGQMEPDALKHLAHTPGLLSLDIAECVQLEVDALKHLSKTPGLRSLDIDESEQLNPSELPAHLSFLLE